MESSHSVMSPSGGAGMRRAFTQPALHGSLMRRVMDRNNLRSAWEQVKANRGAPGVDGIPTVLDRLVAHFARCLQRLISDN